MGAGFSFFLLRQILCCCGPGLAVFFLKFDLFFPGFGRLLLVVGVFVFFFPAIMQMFAPQLLFFVDGEMHYCNDLLVCFRLMDDRIYFVS